VLCALVCPRATLSQAPEPAAIDAAQLIDSVLERYHGPLRGTFDSVILELRSKADDSLDQIVVQGENLRVDHGDKHVDLLIEGTGWRCSIDRPATKLGGSELQALRTLRQGLRAIRLVPLYRAKQIKRVGPGVLALILPGGETWRLALDEKTLDLIELSGPSGVVRFKSFLDTGYTKHAKTVDLPGRGEVYVKFLATDLDLYRAVFADPFVTIDQNKKRPRPGVTQAHRASEELPTEPLLQTVPERTFYVLSDPGTWSQRCADLGTTARMLTDRGQVGTGLPAYQLKAGGTEILIPFQPDPAGGHRPFVRQAGEAVLHSPTHQSVVVAPLPSTWEHAIEAGREAIDAFLEEGGMVASGPLLCIPFLAPGSVPSKIELQRIQVRLELPVTGK